MPRILKFGDVWLNLPGHPWCCITVCLCPSCKGVLRRTESPQQNTGNSFSHCICSLKFLSVLLCSVSQAVQLCLAQGQMQSLYVPGMCPGALFSSPWLTQDSRVMLWSTTYFLDAMQPQASSSAAEMLKGSQTAQQQPGWWGQEIMGS